MDNAQCLSSTMDRDCSTIVLWVLEEYTKLNFYTWVVIILKKFSITLSEKRFGLLGIGSMFKNKFAIGKSCQALKKSMAKKKVT